MAKATLPPHGGAGLHLGKRTFCFMTGAEIFSEGRVLLRGDWSGFTRMRL